MEHFDLFPVVIGIVIALSGSAIAYGNYKIKKSETEFKLRIDMDTSAIPYKDDYRSLLEPIFTITANNIGIRSVTVTWSGVLLPDKKYISYDELDNFENIFPYNLESGKSHSIYFHQPNLTNTLLDKGYSGKLKIRGTYKDAIGNFYTSKPFLINLDDNFPYEIEID